MSQFVITTWLRRSAFRREIACVLLVKTILLSLIWFYGFREPTKHATDASQIQQRLLGDTTTD